MARERQINIRLSHDEYAALDRARGLIPREAFVRELFRRSIEGWPGSAGAAGSTGPAQSPSGQRASQFHDATQRRRKR